VFVLTFENTIQCGDLLQRLVQQWKEVLWCCLEEDSSTVHAQGKKSATDESRYEES
jgi:hypothetical protein